MKKERERPCERKRERPWEGEKENECMSRKEWMTISKIEIKEPWEADKKKTIWWTEIETMQRRERQKRKEDHINKKKRAYKEEREREIM